MQTTEMYFLILACGALGALMVTLAIGTIQDRAWARKTERKGVEPRR